MGRRMQVKRLNSFNFFKKNIDKHMYEWYNQKEKEVDTMEYIILIGIIITIILTIISLTKNINETNITERLGKLETTTIKEISDFKFELSKMINENFTELSEKITKEISEFKIEMMKNLNENIEKLNEKVNTRLDDNFSKTNKTFTSVLERLSKIDEAQKKIDNLSTDIVSLQSILTDKKSRGIFGEINLKHILTSIFGEKNDKIYQLQYTFKNGTIADCVIFAPEPLGTVAIDSKFPLEAYQKMVDKNKSPQERQTYEKQFKNDVKKHIDAISNKYIIPGVTSNQAIMFLPAEAIFAEINAYHSEIIEYANKKRVWITSPTTLMSTLTVIQVLLKNIERDKYASVIHDELNKLGLEFSRYKERWDKLSRSIETVNKDVENIHITTDKISKRFESISSVDIENNKYIE